MNNKNLVLLQGGLTKDPEVFDGVNVVHLSLAVDGAGSEKGVSFPTGYFDVKVWLNESEYTPSVTAKTVKAGIADKSLKKGARISVLGTLKQERWNNKDGSRSSRVVVVADQLEIMNYQQKQNDNSNSASSTNDDSPVVFAPSF